MFKAWPIYRFIPRVILFATLICGPTAASGAPEWDVHEWLEKFAGSQVGWKYLTHSDLGITSVRLDVITDPVYPIVLFWMRTDYQNFLQTERGPRIVVEIDLFASGNRGRDYLNRMAFDRLQKSSSEAAATELRGIFSAHQASVESRLANPPR